MKLFLQYIRQRRRGIALMILFSLIFFVCFALYRLPVKAVLYPAGLCLLIGAGTVTLDFLRIRKKQKILEGIECYTDTLIHALPVADGVEEAEYQRMLKAFCTEQQKLRTSMDLKYSDMMEYYTVWAHQIKTPIAAMRLNLQNEDSSLARRLSADLFRIEQYVEMVMMFLRLDSESSDYVIKKYELDDIVKQAVKNFAGEFISRKLQLVYEPLDFQVITDEKWLSFVIEQVLSNALKYTPAGSITIGMEKPDTLCIRDTGIGIAPEDVPRVFEKGYTGYNGRADKKASGIGLYLCRRICTKLGHSITVQSVLDQGTTIRIRFDTRTLERE